MQIKTRDKLVGHHRPHSSRLSPPCHEATASVDSKPPCEQVSNAPRTVGSFSLYRLIAPGPRRISLLLSTFSHLKPALNLESCTQTSNGYSAAGENWSALHAISQLRAAATHTRQQAHCRIIASHNLASTVAGSTALLPDLNGQV